MVDMQVTIGIESLRNPVILAAGTCGVMGEIADAIDLATIGAITTKSITKDPRIGNEPLRMAELPVGMINAIGLANEGIDSFVRHHAPKVSLLNTSVIGSIAGNTIDQYVSVAAAMDQVDGINLVEVNVSCPYTPDGLEFGATPERLALLLREVRPALSRSSMIVKLSAASGNVCPQAEAAIQCGADALTLINTIPAMAINVNSRSPRIGKGIGGMSGQAIHPIAVRVVHEVYKDVTKDASIPIIGTGGIMHWTDAAEFILAGATAVGIGTALFVDPNIATRVSKRLAKWVEQQGSTSVSELVGAMI